MYKVQYANQNAGTLEIDKFPQDVRGAFKERATLTIPVDFVTEVLLAIEVDLASIQYASELAIAVLLGAWNEASDNARQLLRHCLVVHMQSGSPKCELFYCSQDRR